MGRQGPPGPRPRVLNVDLVPDGSRTSILVTDLTDSGRARTSSSAPTRSSISRRSRRRACDRRARRSGSTPSRRTTSSRPPSAAPVKRVVWASSETVLGLPFDRPPDFAPIDESITPRPESSYALSKLVGETMATEFARRTGVPFVGLRISNIMEPTDYARFPRFQADARLRKWNLWGYVDARDVAAAVRGGARGGHDRRRGLHHRRRRHGDDPRQRRPHGRGLPGRAAPTRGLAAARRCSRSTRRAT